MISPDTSELSCTTMNNLNRKSELIDYYVHIYMYTRNHEINIDSGPKNTFRVFCFEKTLITSRTHTLFTKNVYCYTSNLVQIFLLTVACICFSAKIPTILYLNLLTVGTSTRTPPEHSPCCRSIW